MKPHTMDMPTLNIFLKTPVLCDHCFLCTSLHHHVRFCPKPYMIKYWITNTTQNTFYVVVTTYILQKLADVVNSVVSFL